MKCEACGMESQKLVLRQAWRKNPMKVCHACAEGIDQVQKMMEAPSLINSVIDPRIKRIRELMGTASW